MFCTAEDSWRMCEDIWRNDHVLYDRCEMKVIVVDLSQRHSLLQLEAFLYGDERKEKSEDEWWALDSGVSSTK